MKQGGHVWHAPRVSSFRFGEVLMLGAALPCPLTREGQSGTPPLRLTSPPRVRYCLRVVNGHVFRVDRPGYPGRRMGREEMESQLMIQ